MSFSWLHKDLAPLTGMGEAIEISHPKCKTTNMTHFPYNLSKCEYFRELELGLVKPDKICSWQMSYNICRKKTFCIIKGTTSGKKKAAVFSPYLIKTLVAFQAKNKARNAKQVTVRGNHLPSHL